MRSATIPRKPAALLAVIVTAGFLACGGGGGSAEAPSGGTTIEGNVSRAMTNAHAAAGADTSLGQITVSVSDGSAEVSGATDGSGAFDVVGVPAGDVVVAFRRGDCNGSVPLSDVITNSMILLGDVTMDCDQITPARVDEVFEGLLQNSPTSQSGDLHVIAQAGTSNRTRLVETDSGTSFQDENGNPASFHDFDQNSLIEASGRRDGVGAESTLHASTVKKQPFTIGGNV